MTRIDGSLIGFGDFFDWPGVDPARTQIGATKGKPPQVFKHPPPPAKNKTVEHHGKVLKNAHKTVHATATTIAKALHALSSAPTRRPQVHVGAALAQQMTPKQRAAVAKHNAAAAKATAATRTLAQHTIKMKKSTQALAKAMLAQKKTAVMMRKPNRGAAHVGSSAMYGPTEIGEYGLEYGRYGIGEQGIDEGRYGMGEAGVDHGRYGIGEQGIDEGRYGQYIGEHGHFFDERHHADHLPHRSADVRVVGEQGVDYGRYGAEIGEQVRAAFEEYYTAVGASPDPNNPGYLTDGTPDPAYQAPAQGVDPTVAAALAAPAADPTGQDSGTPLPPAPPIDYLIPDLTQVGAIMYNGEKGHPDGSVLSYNLWTRATDSYAAVTAPAIDGVDHFGYVFGQYWDQFPQHPRGLPFGDDLNPGVWNHVHGRHIMANSKLGGPCDPAEAFASPTQQATQGGVQYGPLIGNPDMKDFAFMRVDLQGNMGWLPQEAPSWLTFPIQQAAALTAQAAAKAAADAKAAQDAINAKTAADAAAALAQQQAQQALAESAATSQANIQTTQAQAQSAQTQAQAEADQAQAETQAQQQLVSQSQADVEEQQLETAQSKQAGDIMAAHAQMQLDYLKSHPEELAQMPGAPDAGGDDGSDDGQADGGDGGDDGGGDDGGDDTADEYGNPAMDMEAMGAEEVLLERFRRGGDVMNDLDGEGFED